MVGQASRPGEQVLARLDEQSFSIAINFRSKCPSSAGWWVLQLAKEKLEEVSVILLGGRVEIVYTLQIATTTTRALH